MLGNGSEEWMMLLPCKATRASVMDCCDGRSMALAKNCSTSPNRSNLMERANSCNGVLNISGVM